MYYKYKEPFPITLFNGVRRLLYGLWLMFFGVLRRQAHKRPVQMAAYNDLKNPNVLLMDTIYPEIGVGVYQGEAVVIREGLTYTEYPRRWVIYKLETPHLTHLGDEDIQLLCRVLQSILTQRYSKSLKTDLRKPNELTKETARAESHDTQHPLCPFGACECADVTPKGSAVYQILKECPRLKYYIMRDTPANHNRTEPDEHDS